MKTGFFQVKHGEEIENSMGRLLAFICTVAGVAGFVYGCVMLDITIVGAGAGLAGSGELLKYGQKRTEK